jgi:tetratricopeptide (TPR) repeat protein
MKSSRKALLISAGVLAVAGGALATFLLRRDEVTTISPAAREAYFRADEDVRRFYFADARADLAEALRLDPDFPLALVSLASLEGESGRPEAARRYVDRAWDLRDSVTAPERYQIEIAKAALDRDQKRVDQLLGEMVESYPRNRWALTMRAHRFQNEGKTEEASALYRRILEIAPSSADAYNQLGYASARRGDFQRAEEYFRKYAFVGGRQANPHDSLGELFLHTGRYAEAEAELRKALEVRPDFYFSELNLALVRRKQGNYADAERILADVLPKIDRNGTKLNVRILGAIFALEQQEFDRAAKIFEETEKDLPPAGADSDRGTLRAARGAALLEQGRVDEARALAAEARTFVERAMSEVSAKNPGLGKESLEQRTCRSLSTVRYLESQLASRDGDHERALALLRECDESPEGLPFGSNYTAMIGLFRQRILIARELAELGRLDEAKQMLHRNLSVDPNDRFSKAALAELQEGD